MQMIYSSLLTITDEVERGLRKVGQSADIGRRQIVSRVRVVGECVELAQFDQLTNTDHYEVNIGAFSEERLTNRT